MFPKYYCFNRALLFFLVFFLFVFMAGCGAGEERDEPSSLQGEKGKEKLRIGSPWFPGNLQTVDGATVLLRLGVIDTLVDIDYDGELVPGLAEEWEVSEDGLTWTFKLREDVYFHDGTPMETGAVEKSLLKLQEDGTLFEDVPVEDIKAVDEYTLEISTSEYFAPLPSYLTKGETAPISPHSYDEEGNFKELLGTGAYQFKEWEPEQKMVLTKNEEYWGEIPQVETVVYKRVPEASTRILMLRNNEIDIAQVLPAEKVEELEAQGGIDIYTEPILRTRKLNFNLSRDPFEDLQVRKAVKYAVDRDALVEHITAGIDLPAQGPFPPVSKWAHDDLQEYPYNEEKAQELLLQAGYEKGEDGYFVKNGERLSAELITYPERAELPLKAEVIQHQLDNLGIEVDLKVLEYGQADERKSTGSFDMYLMSRNLGFIPEPGLFLMSDYHSKNTEGTGYGGYGYSNEELDAVLEKAQSTKDKDERAELYSKAQEIIVEDIPVVFLSHYVNIDAVSSHVQGYEMHPLESTFGLEHVYFEQ